MVIWLRQLVWKQLLVCESGFVDRDSLSWWLSFWTKVKDSKQSTLFRFNQKATARTTTPTNSLLQCKDSCSHNFIAVRAKTLLFCKHKWLVFRLVYQALKFLFLPVHCFWIKHQGRGVHQHSASSKKHVLPRIHTWARGCKWTVGTNWTGWFHQILFFIVTWDLCWVYKVYQLAWTV